jgi:anthranilate phosphoribosyltransferase
MEALGVNITMPATRIADCLREVGIAFMFAPAMHTATRYVQPARRELRPLRSVFNLLGPLTNPARASAQVVGVYSEALVEKLATALQMLGLNRALVVHGADGLDEISISGPTRIGEVRGEWVRVYEVTPDQFGFSPAPLSAISGGDARQNADIILEILRGEKSPHRNIVLMNAAAALVAAGRADSLKEAMPVAVASIDSGAARGKLEALVEFTNRRFV